MTPQAPQSPMPDPLDMTLLEARDAVADKTLTSEQLTRACLDRIDRHNARLHAFTQVFEQRALAQARRVDAGEQGGPLAGVPIAIKDVLCTAYGKTTCGSKMLENFQAPYTATCVERLEAAGAVILGKTNMDEFAMGSSTENSALGVTRNPWAPDYVPGGSSGGAAAAMGAGMCFGSIGTDTGGSIRQPAAYCGVVGFKPSYGRISRYGLVAFASSLDQAGPLAKSVADAALLGRVMSGPDALDSTCADLPEPAELPADPPDAKTLRIGMARQYLSDSNDPAVQDAAQRAIDAYRNAGAEIVEVDLPHTHYGISVYYIVATAEASSNLARYDGVHYGHRTQEKVADIVELYSRSRAEGFGDEVKRRIMLGTYALSSGYYDAYYDRALKVRRLIQQDFVKAFEQCDAILCPTAPTPAFKLGESIDDPLTMYLNDMYTVPASLAGIPAVTLPAGFAERDGVRLPVGVQLIGPAFEETKLLGVAKLFESMQDRWSTAVLD